MNRDQFIFLVVVNAIVSAVVSLIVMYVGFSLVTPAAPAANAPAPVAVATGTARPLGSPSPTRRAVAVTYVVKPGDTLSSIAAAFNISTAALMQANGITNPNILTVGQPLTIPPLDVTVAPAPFSTPGTPVASPAPILRISAILRSANPPSPVGETVIIQNLGARVNLKSWSLADLHGNTYAFPDIVLETNMGLRLHSESGLDTAADLYWGRPSSVWDSNDTATLKDRAGVVIDSYTVRR